MNIYLAQSSGMNVAPLLLSAIVVALLFFFMVARPQKKSILRQKELMSSLKPGDEIITAGGIYGEITRIEEDSAMIKVALDTEIKVALRSITMKKAPVQAEPTES
ncbi:MAG: preprotein translocase subunit YajC [Acidimicrobiia bacterium]